MLVNARYPVQKKEPRNAYRNRRPKANGGSIGASHWSRSCDSHQPSAWLIDALPPMLADSRGRLTASIGGIGIKSAPRVKCRPGKVCGEAFLAACACRVADLGRDEGTTGAFGMRRTGLRRHVVGESRGGYPVACAAAAPGSARIAGRGRGPNSCRLRPRAPAARRCPHGSAPHAGADRERRRRGLEEVRHHGQQDRSVCRKGALKQRRPFSSDRGSRRQWRYLFRILSRSSVVFNKRHGVGCTTRELGRRGEERAGIDRFLG